MSLNDPSSPLGQKSVAESRASFLLPDVRL